jgi:exportin-2 (importin alpha re-exporter)
VAKVDIDFSTLQHTPIPILAFNIMQATPENLQFLSQALTSTVSPDSATRRAAEEQLRSGEQQAGFLQLVLDLVRSDNVEMVVRQAAGVYFKNAVKRLWEPEEVSNGIAADGSTS